MVLVGLGGFCWFWWFWLVLVGFGWFWLVFVVLVGFGWFWWSRKVALELVHNLTHSLWIASVQPGLEKVINVQGPTKSERIDTKRQPKVITTRAN